MAQELVDSGVKLITDGTDNHMMVANTVQSFGIDGKLAEQTLDKISIAVNKQIIPDDPNPPLRPSGIRLGTPAATTRGMKEDDMKKLGAWIVEALKNHQNENKLEEIKKEVEGFCVKFPVPGI
ncbi:MAG: hypothetical protein A2184_03750 [Candidatus Moranbacteria bacterium RIFOXYA1_FULL_44_7]|nr:MAG: hypothetical protein A2184_03750 [Candidatus Moranbacteria bacterium RIFOXYA1_FULL_44_7]